MDTLILIYCLSFSVYLIGLRIAINLLKNSFQQKIEQEAPQYINLIENNFNDKDVDHVIEYFRDPERRKAFFKVYKELEMLYEIISPDAFLHPYMDTYTTLSSIYEITRKAYTQRVQVDKAVQRKTDELVQKHIGTSAIKSVTDFVEINDQTLNALQNQSQASTTQVINLIKSIENNAEENNSDPFLIAMAERAKAIQDKFENRQTNTQDTLDLLLQEIERDEQRKQEQAKQGFGSLTYFVHQILEEAEVNNSESVSNQIREAFIQYPNWQNSESELRELRNQVTFAICAELDDLDEVTAIVDQVFTKLKQTL